MIQQGLDWSFPFVLFSDEFGQTWREMGQEVSYYTSAAAAPAEPEAATEAPRVQEKPTSVRAPEKVHQPNNGLYFATASTMPALHSAHAERISLIKQAKAGMRAKGREIM